MDLGLVNAAIGFQKAQTASRVQYAVARKLLDAQRDQGAAAVKLIQAAGATGAKAGDALVAGAGGSVDVYA